MLTESPDSLFQLAGEAREVGSQLRRIARRGKHGDEHEAGFQAVQILARDHAGALRIVTDQAAAAWSPGFVAVRL